MDTTIPTTGVIGYTPEQFTDSGQTAVVRGDTLIIAAATRANSGAIIPITDLVSYNLGKIGHDLQMTRDLAGAYTGGLVVKGSSKSDSLIFGRKTYQTDVSNTYVDLSLGGSDTLSIVGKTSFKKTTVVIDANDKITKGAATFTSEAVNANGRIKGLGGITFDVV